MAENQLRLIQVGRGHKIDWWGNQTGHIELVKVRPVNDSHVVARRVSRNGCSRTTRGLDCPVCYIGGQHLLRPSRRYLTGLKVLIQIPRHRGRHI